jgi:hypothetical protein
VMWLIEHLWNFSVATPKSILFQSCIFVYISRIQWVYLFMTWQMSALAKTL